MDTLPRSPAQSHETGLTLIEAMVTVALLGILAAIAVPAYQDFTIRSKVSEALGIASSLKSQVVEEATNGGLTSIQEGTLAQSAQSTQYVEGFDVADGGIIRVRMQGTGAAVEPELHLVPNEAGGAIVWTCMKTPETRPSHVPPSCRQDSSLALSEPPPTRPSYDISLDPAQIQRTTSELFRAFADFTNQWLAAGNAMPVGHSSYGSLDWRGPNYTGTDRTNLLHARFWNEFYASVNVDGLSATNPAISDFKVFYARDAQGRITGQVQGVYLQLGGTRSIYFANGTTVSGPHYTNYIQNAQLIQP
jgi:prepilin-type N-terminal cleavage/methylation domain-containing protein